MRCVDAVFDCKLWYADPNAAMRRSRALAQSQTGSEGSGYGSHINAVRSSSSDLSERSRLARHKQQQISASHEATRSQGRNSSACQTQRCRQTAKAESKALSMSEQHFMKSCTPACHCRVHLTSERLPEVLSLVGSDKARALEQRTSMLLPCGATCWNRGESRVYR